MTNQEFFAQAIYNLTGGANYSSSPQDDGSFIIEWNDEKPEPSQAEINAEIKKLKSEYKKEEYSRNRRNEYPNWDFQLDYIFHNGLEKWKNDIVQPVKDKHPKP